MSTHKPAVDCVQVAVLTRTSYPEPYASRVTPREKRRLGDAFGLTRIGINRTTLFAGKESSMRHWHTAEDEFIYILEGEVLLRTGSGEQLLTAGMCVGFPAGIGDGHQLINRSARPAVYLEISNRDAADVVHYSDADVDMVATSAGITRRDGTPFTST